jgi:glucose/arabinose dehydrogenase
MKKNIIIIILTVLLVITLAIIGLIWWEFIYQRAPSATVEKLSLVEGPHPESVVLEEEKADVPIVTSVSKGLEITWGMAFLPDGSILLTERPGRVRLVDYFDGLKDEPVFEPEDVSHIGEGGLLGIALHPEYEKNNLVYLYYTYETGEIIKNKIVRYTYDGDTFINPEIIIEEIPGAQFHNGGRIEFGPDGMLYVATGDSVFPQASQTLEDIAGKILRMTPDGEIPEDNPFENSYVYSYGHRNPQGLAWDDEGNLWETEHGQQATDEVNLIEPGSNYGWPDIIGDENAEGIVSPVIQSGNVTWAPSGMAYLNGSLYFAGLRGQTLYELTIVDGKPVLEEHFVKQFGRLRDVVVGPDEFLYVLTSNRDGRGVPFAEDDRVLRINVEKL